MSRRVIFIGAAVLFPFLLLLAVPIDVAAHQSLVIVPTESVCPDAEGNVVGAPYFQAKDLFHLVNHLIQTVVLVATAVATLMFAYAGFLYVTASARSENLTQAKNIFTKVLLGFVIILLAWIIVDLILTTLTPYKNGFGFWADIQCGETPTLQDAAGSGVATTTSGGSGGAQGAGTACVGGCVNTAQSQQCAQENGFLLSSTGGPSQVRDGCTGAGCSEYILQENTLNFTAGLIKESGCTDVQLTGGSERSAGHDCTINFSHCTGHKVDIDDNSKCFNDFMADEYKITASEGARGSVRGNRVLFHDSHFDVQVTQNTYGNVCGL